MPRPLVRDGVSAVLRQPGLFAAEIAWRWSFGAAASFLVALALDRALTATQISAAEIALVSGDQALAIADALARMIYDFLPRLALAAAILVPALVLLWIAAASPGRWVTLQALLAGRAPDHLHESSPAKPSFASLVFVNFLRAALAVATAAGLLGAGLIAGIVVGPGDPAAAALLALTIAALVAFLWSVVNWFLALAPVFILRDGRSALPAIADSLALLTRYPSEYVSITISFGLLRGIALLAALFLSLAALAATDSVAVALTLSVPIALAYFAAADFLYIARLAALVGLAEGPGPETGVAAEPQPPAGIAELPNCGTAEL